MVSHPIGTSSPERAGSWFERIEVDLDTGAGVTDTKFTRIVDGKVYSIQYVPDPTDPFDATMDVAITGETTGQQIWVESNVGATAKTVGPSIPTHDEIGDASFTQGSLVEAIERAIPIVGERIKVVVTQGGVGNLGKFQIVIQGSVQGVDAVAA